MYSSAQAAQIDAEIQSSARRRNATTPVGGGMIVARLFAGILRALHELRRRQAARVIQQYRSKLDATK